MQLEEPFGFMTHDDNDDIWTFSRPDKYTVWFGKINRITGQTEIRIETGMVEMVFRGRGAALALVDAAASRMRATIHISLGPALVVEKIHQVFFAKLD